MPRPPDRRPPADASMAERRTGLEPYVIGWHDQVAEIRLQCGKANALNARSLTAIAEAFDAVSKARGVVLTGYDRFFSAGLDLIGLYQLDRAEMDDFMREFDRVMLQVFAFPRPVVAAVTGHAVAGGCVLALACDARVASMHGPRIGLNEIRLGVPFPASALEIVRHALPPVSIDSVLFGGELHDPPAAMAHGLVTALVPGPPEAVLTEARARCRQLSAQPPGAFEAIKASLKRSAVRGAHERLDYLRRAFVEAWFSAEARRRIGEARARLTA